MKTIILAAIAALSTACAAHAQAQSSPYGSARGWQVNAHFENGHHQGCSATLTAANYWMTLENHPMIGWAVQVGLPALFGGHNGIVDIDRASFDLQFYGDGGQVNFAASDPMIGAIRAGNHMSLSVPGVWAGGQVPLRGTAAAISKIQECSRNQGQVPAAATSAAPSGGGAQRGHSSCPGWASYPSQDMGGAAEAYFLNATGRALIVYWIDDNGVLQEMGALPANDGFVQPTFIGHNFVARDRDGRCYGDVLAVSGPSIRFTVQ